MGELSAMSGWELLAVLLSITYLVLAMRQNLWCWYAAFVSTSIFLFLFWNVNLLMDSALQIYYLAMAVYGWYQWKYGHLNGNDDSEGVPIHRWDLRQHSLAIGAVVIAALISGVFLQKNTDAAWPFVDSFTTWGAVLTTWMVTRKVLENWLYWIVIDAVSVALYWDRGLYLTSLLFVAYVVICIFGWFNWQRQLREEPELVPQQG
ncbi:nicotinamide mononucleotide transporter [Pseudomaricurvus alkylphenolicus]|uniref:nicotinamide riboside transporter PnuC n=1 Tax=Pseudomaricurvus alkylphenolicus TaxID=1306991 RepID=UPI00142319B5|nr:nicotinamide riboside transporter PnuC [Pseudomaricurvus alkylphenolicus]NIB44013.1 nicotinamide mononucleotide transporter [Pseudomaricurvus alkylphenolicus]